MAEEPSLLTHTSTNKPIRTHHLHGLYTIYVSVHILAPPPGSSIAYVSSYESVLIITNGSTALLLELGRFWSFLLLHRVGRRTWDEIPVRRKALTYTQDNTSTRNTQKSMPAVAFEPMSPAFERTKTLHGSDGVAAVVGEILQYGSVSVLDVKPS
jgi:hypothetical protein